MKLYLDIPYKDKEEAKSLGARWNPYLKKWYVDTEPEEYIKFAKWILGSSSVTDSLIIYSDIYLIEGNISCCKCEKTTKVVGLGYQDYISIHADWDRNNELIEPSIEVVESDDLRLVKIPSAKYLPPLLLKYLRDNYSFKHGWGNRVCNFCCHCGKKQNDYYVYDDEEISLASYSEQVQNLVIKSIAIKDAFIFNEWDSIWCSTDWKYLYYNDGIEIVHLIENSDKYEFSYEDLYLLN